MTDARPIVEVRESKLRRERGTGHIFRPKFKGKDGQWHECPHWRIQYYKHGVRFVENAKSDRITAAKELLKRRLGEIASGQFTPPQVERVRVEELGKELLRNYRINGHKSAKIAEKKWAKYIKPFFGALRAVDVTTDTLNRYVEKRLQQAAANATINRELALLRRAFNLAYRSTPRKVSQVLSFPHLKENPPRKGFVEDAQYTRLCENCSNPWLRAMLAVAYSFGFRKSELLNMTVRQVDLLSRTIALDPGTTKNDEGRAVKMTQETYELLCGSIRGKNSNDFVFTREDGRQIRDFRRAWDKLCDAAELTELLFHDLRRSAVRNMVRRGVSERVAMKISGHKTRTVFDRYNIVSESDLADAARKIEAGKDVAPRSYIPEVEWGDNRCTTRN